MSQEIISGVASTMPISDKFRKLLAQAEHDRIKSHITPECGKMIGCIINSYGAIGRHDRHIKSVLNTGFNNKQTHFKEIRRRASPMRPSAAIYAASSSAVNLAILKCVLSPIYHDSRTKSRCSGRRYVKRSARIGS